jgi:hypothetical protein
MVWLTLQSLLAGIGFLFGVWWLVRNHQISEYGLWAVLLTGILIAATYSTMRTTAIARDLRLVCPGCDKMLVATSAPQGGFIGQELYEETAVSGTCIRCGTKVLQDG